MAPKNHVLDGKFGMGQVKGEKIRLELIHTAAPRNKPPRNRPPDLGTVTDWLIRVLRIINLAKQIAVSFFRRKANIIKANCYYSI